jgi:hypothetical protein
MADSLITAVVFAVMTSFLALGTVALASSIRRSQWSLAAALSEDGRPSSSRLASFMGLLATGTVLLGVGYACVWRILSGSNLPDLAGLSALIAGSGTLFVPYLANQFKQAMTTSGQPAPQPTPQGAPPLALPPKP